MAVPLLNSMNQSVGRYIGSYSRDYFYATANAS